LYCRRLGGIIEQGTTSKEADRFAERSRKEQNKRIKELAD
jgi:hypothetical protein